MSAKARARKPAMLLAAAALLTGTLPMAAGCSGQTSPYPSAPAGPTLPSPAATMASAASPGARCPVLSVPADPTVACAELQGGVETYSDQAPRSVTDADYYVIGECVGSGDLDELPYTVKVDDRVVTSGSITCRSGVITRNSAFGGLSGTHRVSVRFADGIGANATGHAQVTTG